MGVEANAGIDAVFGVDGSLASPAAAGPNELAVRGRGGALTPDVGEGMGMMGVDDRYASGEGRGIRCRAGVAQAAFFR
uniref:Histidine kinase n=1 Tax=Xanthobacter flavus TaxID=281 RepID=A0A168S7B2_XANFL|nr:histidine kinase [Xanthobacter flavus]